MRPAGLYVRFGSRIDEESNERVHALMRGLLTRPLEGVTDLVPGYASLYVEFDATRRSKAEVMRWIDASGEQSAQAGRPGERGVVEIPVVYDGEDLARVASALGSTTLELARHHSEPTYRVYACGFLPGFPFMGEVPEQIRSPRHPNPRKRVPAHSLAMAGNQTGIYPLDSPGGWQLLGRSLVAIYDPNREQPFLLEPGHRVRFVARKGGTSPAEPEPLRLLPREPARPVLEVREPGLLDLVLDGGRQMVGRFGLSRSGPLDPASAALANALLGNPRTAPLLELNLHGPVLECLEPVVVAFAGYGLLPAVDGRVLEPFASFALARGELLSFESDPAGRGCRAYLAVAGGIESETFAGSASVDLRGLIGRPLREGDLLGRASTRQVKPGRSFVPHRGSGRRLRLLPGPQASAEAGRELVQAQFTVAEGDRVGLRLDGAQVPGGEILSEAVPVGALQVPPGGRPILLLNDRGSLGGYDKPALLHPEDLPLAGQLRPGDRVRFELVDGEWVS
ncbi:MAG TPA: 5-oxoprolinase subunit PxpB [Trueperaceae bacterium]